jgi:hypothetical protein
VGKVTCDMTMSVDGFVAGPNQSLENAFRRRDRGRHMSYRVQSAERTS